MQKCNKLLAVYSFLLLTGTFYELAMAGPEKLAFLVLTKGRFFDS